MPKFNYYDCLQRLSVLSSRAVYITCSNSPSAKKSEICALRNSADRAICELERYLFSDFMPPLERSDLALCAHALSRVIESACELSGASGQKSFSFERKNKEAEICIRLSQIIEQSISRLRYIKRPEELPDLVGFRKLLCEARHWHALTQKKLCSGVYPRSAESYLFLLRRLTASLERCFDTLIEVMLSSI